MSEVSKNISASEIYKIQEREEREERQKDAEKITRENNCVHQLVLSAS